MVFDTKYYDLLEVEPTANRETIAKAYRRLALHYHPLRNDPSKQANFSNKFSKLAQAYSVLSDPKAKSVYDTHGPDSVAEGVTDENGNEWPGHVYHGDAYATFSQTFGFSNPFCDEMEQQADYLKELNALAHKNRADDVCLKVACTMFEFYNGALKKINYEANCHLEGAEESQAVVSKFRELTIQLRPYYNEKTVLTFPGLGHESFGAHKSDLIVTFKQEGESGGFCRDGNDLVYWHKCTLAEALGPMCVSVKTLDGRTVCATPNEYVTSETVLEICGEGMPNAGVNDFVIDAETSLLPVSQMPKGSLKIKFDIHFPKKILSQHRDTILQALTAAN